MKPIIVIKGRKGNNSGAEFTLAYISEKLTGRVKQFCCLGMSD